MHSSRFGVLRELKALWLCKAGSDLVKMPLSTAHPVLLCCHRGQAHGPAASQGSPPGCVQGDSGDAEMGDDIPWHFPGMHRGFNSSMGGAEPHTFKHGETVLGMPRGEPYLCCWGMPTSSMGTCDSAGAGDAHRWMSGATWDCWYFSLINGEMGKQMIMLFPSVGMQVALAYLGIDH